MRLIIDTCTTDQDEISVGSSKLTDTLPNEAQTTNSPVIAKIHRLLVRNQLAITDITEIQVNPGPGTRFTRTRLGVTTANALAYALDISVNQKIFEIPQYHQEPNITISRNP